MNTWNSFLKMEYNFISYFHSLLGRYLYYMCVIAGLPFHFHLQDIGRHFVTGRHLCRDPGTFIVWLQIFLLITDLMWIVICCTIMYWYRFFLLIRMGTADYLKMRTSDTIGTVGKHRSRWVHEICADFR